MSNSKPVNKVTVESWKVNKGTTQAKTITKVAVRVRKGLPGAGQFHGATNFKGSVL